MNSSCVWQDVYRLHCGTASARASAGVSPATAREGAPWLGAPGEGRAEAGLGVSGSTWTPGPRCPSGTAAVGSRSSNSSVWAGQVEPVRLNKYIRISPSSQLVLGGYHRRAQSSQTQDCFTPTLAATHPNSKDGFGMRAPQSFGLPRKKSFSAWKPGRALPYQQWLSWACWARSCSCTGCHSKAGGFPPHDWGSYHGSKLHSSCVGRNHRKQDILYYIVLRACNGQVGNLHILTADQNTALLALALAV